MDSRRVMIGPAASVIPRGYAGLLRDEGGRDCG